MVLTVGKTRKREGDMRAARKRLARRGWARWALASCALALACALATTPAYADDAAGEPAPAFDAAALRSIDVQPAANGGPAIPGHAGLNHVAFDMDPAKPFAADVYYGRTLLTSEGQKAWDHVLDLLLHYDNADGARKVSGGNASVVVNYADLGIRPTADDARRIQSYLVRNEARMFHLKDWAASFTQAGGVVTKQTFTVGNGMAAGSNYQNALRNIEAKVQQMLKANLKADMTIYQQTWALREAYEGSVSYKQEGACSDLRGAFLNGKAICGGYAKGWMYLMHHLGINTIWVEGYANVTSSGNTYHAWNYLLMDGAWYMCDTTWGGANWWMQSGTYAPNRKHNATFAVMPTLSDTRIPQAWGSYPGISLSMKESTVVAKGAELDPQSLVIGYSNIYGEDLTENLQVTVERVSGPGDIAETGRIDTTMTGDWLVTASVFDSHGNSASKTARVSVVEGEVLEFGGANGFTLLQGGKEVPYAKGIIQKEASNNPKVIDLPAGEHRLFEATVGVLGSVRQNTQWGSNCKVAFKVEFLDAANQVVGEAFQTQTHGWKHEAEDIELAVPDQAAKARLTMLRQGSGNNHGAWAGVRVVELDRLLPSAVGVAGGLSDLVYNGSPAPESAILVSGSTGAVSFTWERRSGAGWEALDAAPSAAGEYRVTASVAADAVHAAASGSVEFQIAKAPLSVPSVQVADKAYDGTTEARVESVSFEGLVAGETLEAGTDYEASASFDGAGASPSRDVSVELALTDSAKASNYELAPGPFAAQAAISYGSVALEADEASFTLLRDGAETAYDRGFVQKEAFGNPRVVDLPTGERRVLSATAGVLGSVRQNVKWGHYCKVAFRVEFLDAQGRLIGDAFQTQTHGWKHEAEDIELAVPDQAVQARLTMLCQGSGNNHGAWANLEVASVADKLPSEIEITENLEGLAYNGSPVAEPAVRASGSTGAVTFSWERRSGEGWEALGAAPSAAGEYRVTAHLAEGLVYAGAVSQPVEFSIAKVPLSVVSAQVADKVYDGTADARVESVAFEGVVAGESLEAGTHYQVVGAFDDPSASLSEKGVAVSVELTDAAAENYQLENASVRTQATISYASTSVEASAAEHVAYGEDLVVTVTLSSESEAALAESETVHVWAGRTHLGELEARPGAPAQFVYDTAEKGLAVGSNSLTVQFRGNANATGSVSSEVRVELGKRDAAVTVEGPSKAYDGTTALPQGSSVVASGAVADDDVRVEFASAAYDHAEAARASAVLVEGVTLAGADAQWYSAPPSVSVPASVAKAPLSISSAQVADKAYDGTTEARVESVSFEGLVAGEALEAGADYEASASFDGAGASGSRVAVVTVALADSAKAANYELASGSFETRAAIAEGSVALEVGKASFTLLQDGKETAYSQGVVQMERSNNPKVVDLPAGERRVLSATAGVLGSVRQNLKWGHYCKVAFRVEFLDAQGRLIGDAFQTGAHGWKHEAEKVSVAVPDQAVQARLTMLCQGSGNNHGAWADLAVSSFADDPSYPAAPSSGSGA